jgi:hypothetical protein
MLKHALSRGHKQRSSCFLPSTAVSESIALSPHSPIMHDACPTEETGIDRFDKCLSLLGVRAARNLAAAVRAPRGAFLDLLEAVRALRCLLLDLFLLRVEELVLCLLEAVHGLDHAEDDEGDDEEVDDSRDEGTEVDGGARHDEACDLGAAAGDEGDQRIDDVRAERRHDVREGTADDDADCHIHHIAAGHELPEFLDEAAHVCLPFASAFPSLNCMALFSSLT